MSLSKKEVLEQSRSAMDQWGPTWAEHAKQNGELYKKIGTSHKDLLFNGAGRSLLCIANAPSFKNNIDLLVKYKDTTKVDIACVDKCMSMLLDNGIKPLYVFIADAGISYEDWCEPYIEHTEDIVLISNITANPKWAANWKGPVFFHVNKDNIESEKIYMEISGCMEIIPASSNVGNTVIVFSTQVLGYDSYCLLGYDLCWGDDEDYYATGDSVKRHWMKHLAIVDNIGRLVNTSQNLFFSARWLQDFYDFQAGRMRIYNCSGQGLLNIPKLSLEKVLNGATVRKLDDKEKEKIIQARMCQIVVTKDGGPNELNEVIKNTNVATVVVNHIPQEVIEWLEV